MALWPWWGSGHSFAPVGRGCPPVLVAAASQWLSAQPAVQAPGCPGGGPAVGTCPGRGTQSVRATPAGPVPPRCPSRRSVPALGPRHPPGPPSGCGEERTEVGSSGLWPRGDPPDPVSGQSSGPQRLSCSPVGRTEGLHLCDALQNVLQGLNFLLQGIQLGSRAPGLPWPEQLPQQGWARTPTLGWPPAESRFPSPAHQLLNLCPEGRDGGLLL